MLAHGLEVVDGSIEGRGDGGPGALDGSGLALLLAPKQILEGEQVAQADGVVDLGCGGELLQALLVVSRQLGIEVDRQRGRAR